MKTPAGEGAAPRRRVLIIDDDPLVRRVMRRVLSRSFDIEEVESAESAVMRLDRGERFDVVVCDLMLGDGLSGRAFYDRTLARDPALASGFIMTSGSEALVGAIGTDRFLQKPFSGDTLLAVVERIADQQATEAA